MKFTQGSDIVHYHGESWETLGWAIWRQVYRSLGNEAIANSIHFRAYPVEGRQSAVCHGKEFLFIASINMGVTTLKYKLRGQIR